MVSLSGFASVVAPIASTEAPQEHGLLHIHNTVFLSLIKQYTDNNDASALFVVYHR